ncbi:MAG TPA: tRNA dihydrouridine synthase DusB [Vicinamibacterales bacterium]
MRIGALPIRPALGVAPMAGMTDTAFRRLVKRQGGCGLVVSEMVSSEGLVRGIDRTLEYAEYTEEERPVSIQIFGGDPERMAEAARIVEGMGADVVDINMGCPVPKISKHHAGCSLMRDPKHAAAIVEAMVKAVRIPVTVKMRAGWNEQEITAPEVARRVADAGASAVTVHGRTAKQAYTGQADWELVARVAAEVSVPVFGSGDCVEPEQVVERLRSTGVAGVLVGRGVLRNPWILAQASDLLAGRPARVVTPEERGRFLLDYIDLLLRERVDEEEGFRHMAPMTPEEAARMRQEPAQGRERWVINKLRALMSWYSKGLDGGSQLRIAVNAATSIAQVRDIIHAFFMEDDARNQRASASAVAAADPA